MPGFELPPSLWPVLHALATPEPWPPSAASADRFVGEARRHGLLQLLFFSQHGLPDTVRPALYASRVELLRQIARTKRLIELQQTLGRLLGGEPFVFLKGGDFMHRLYPQPDLRPMADVDLLVPTSRMRAVCEHLERHGLTPSFPGGPSRLVATHHERAFILDGLLVEVHQTFIQRPRHRIDYEGIWRRRVPLGSLAPTAARLDDVDALVYQGLTMAIDQFFVPLLRCVDLWLLSRVAPGLVRAAAMRAREWRAAHAFYGALRFTGRLLPEFLTPEVEDAMNVAATPLERRFLDRWILPPGPAGGDAPRRMVALWRKFWLMDTLDRRAAFALYQAWAGVAGRLVARRARSRREAPRPPTHAST